MKTYTFFRHHAALRLGSLAIAACGMAMFMNSCQDEDFGFVKEEIAASAAHRHYIEKFEKEFATIDPTHTWLCTPDTTYGASLRAITRAVEGTPVVNQVQDTVLTIPYLEVKAALGFVDEAQDNRGICSQDFEYVSTADKYVFDVHPTFWGRKFCEHNAVGVWYIDAAGNKVDLKAFWEDWNNKIYAVCEHGIRQNIQNSTSPLTDKPNEAWNENIPMTLHQHTETLPCGGKIEKKTSWGNTTYVCNSCGATYNKDSNNKTCTKQVDKQVTCPVDHYEFPSYQIEVPVGMKWGLYLETYQNQSNSKPLIRWYSNAQYNPNNASAAASFEFGGINYVSFEDAPNPYNCSNTSNTGTCQSCQTYNGQHFGHYDHDMNDIVLAITPHPIESTYKSISYRVMCEDLGGTFDWDFNDLVLDVVYEEGTQKGAKAKTTITVQAVGGTLPIELLYNNASIPGVGELHTWFDQTADLDGMFKPINVSNGETKTPKVAYTIEHDWVKMDGTYDVREIVQDISVKVANYTTVAFPDSKGGDVPQCFMCPINVHWSDELINISDTYSDFPGWVASQGNNPTWWNSGFNTGTQEVVQTK